MSRKRKIPRNPDCPLSKTERKDLLNWLDHIEWIYYMPYKWQSAGYSEAKVIEYDEIGISISVKHGVDGDRHYEDSEFIYRNQLLNKRTNEQQA